MTRALMAAFFPGPLTLVLPKHPNIDGQLTGGKDTIALRAPNHALFQDVLRELARLKNTKHVALAASSANLHGQDSPTKAEQVEKNFGDIFRIDGGESVIGVASTIVDLTSGVPMVSRTGHITLNDIERVLNESALHPQN
jgi:L-threonylcarbamoyladenylate synthase